MEKSINIFEYLDNNSSKDKDYLIQSIMLKLQYTQRKAIELYYYWKSKFMKSVKCIPKDTRIPMKRKFKVKGNIVIGEYGEYRILDSCIVVGYHFFNTIYEIEKYRCFRRENNLKAIDNILDEAIEVMKFNILSH